MTRRLIFSNPIIEESFRTAMRKEQEIGGWLLAAWEPKNWPGRYHYGQVKRAFGVAAMCIESYIVAPNESEKNREISYRPWDWVKAKALAEATAKSFGCVAIPFHSHPNGNRELSTADIAIAARYEQTLTDWAWTVIATPGPLRLWFYEIRWGTLARPDASHEILMSESVSWRSRTLRQFLE